MSLLSNQKNFGHIVDAIIHFNRARDISESSKVEIARTLFDGLNKLQTQWVVEQSKPDVGEVTTFQSMILDLRLPEARNNLLQSKELCSVVGFQPRIMNHQVLRHRRYRPGVPMEPSLAREASQVHQKLIKAYAELDGVDQAKEDRVLKRTAELLYIVRSNIAHGEKTPYGPDLTKRERDEAVCTVIVPLQEILIDQLLNRPTLKLVVYGTLAPGQLNHYVIETISGAWTSCIVRGCVSHKLGFPVLTWNPAGSAINAQLLVSADLPQSWSRIDAFEGLNYRRHLIPAVDKHELTVANVYVEAKRGSSNVSPTEII